MKKRLRFALAGIVTLVLVGALIYWQHPARVADTAVSKLGTTTNQVFVTNVSIENAQATQDLLGEAAVLNIQVAGAFKRQTDQRDSLIADVRLTTKTESVSMLIEAQTRFIGDQAYLRITKSPPAIPVLTQLKDQWLEFPRGGAEAASQVVTGDSLFTEVKRVGRENIQESSTIMYEATATSSAILLMLDGMADILGTRLTEVQIADIRAGVSAIEALPVTLWISPISHELRQLAAKLTIPGSNAVTFTLTLTDNDKLADITAPEGAISLQQAAANIAAQN